MSARWRLLLSFLLPAFVFFAAAAEVSSQDLRRQDINQKEAVGSIDEVLSIANRYHREGNYTKAVELYEKSLVSSPNDYAIYNNLGADYAFLQEYEKARQVLEKAVKLKPDFAMAHFNLSIVYNKLGLLKKAFKFALQAAKLKPKNEKIRTHLCEVEMRSALEKKAVECFEELIGLAGENARIQTSYGLLLLRTDRLKKALDVLSEASKLFPNDLSVQNIYGLALLKKKRYNEAVAVFRRIIQIDAGFEIARFNLGHAYVLKKDKTAALDQYRILSATNPKLSGSLFKLIYGDKLVFVDSNSK